MGAALTQDQQLFVSANLSGFRAFVETEEGKIAVQTFVSDWMALAKPSLPADR